MSVSIVGIESHRNKAKNIRASAAFGGLHSGGARTVPWSVFGLEVACVKLVIGFFWLGLRGVYAAKV